jgi:hypothetical protein
MNINQAIQRSLNEAWDESCGYSHIKLKIKRKPIMNLQDTINRYQKHIDAGHLDPNMPSFMLIACDMCAPSAILEWIDHACEAGSPQHYIESANATLKAFEAWPTKRVPGSPVT